MVYVNVVSCIKQMLIVMFEFVQDVVYFGCLIDCVLRLEVDGVVMVDLGGDCVDFVYFMLEQFVCCYFGVLFVGFVECGGVVLVLISSDFVVIEKVFGGVVV